MSTSLPILLTSDKFQTWFQRTNDLITALNTTILTASGAGDTTAGNAILTGAFTANTVNVGDTLRVNILDTKIGNSAPIELRSIAKFTSTSQDPIWVKNSIGPRIKLENNSIVWEAGLKGSSGTGANSEFIISANPTNPNFRFTSTGVLYANTVISSSGIILNNNISPGLYLNGVSFNGSSNTVFNVDASSSSISNKVVARDAAGNFSANTVTINSLIALSSSSITLNKNISPGLYLNGTSFNGSSNTVFNVDASSSSISNKVVVRDVAGNFSANTVTINNLVALSRDFQLVPANSSNIPDSTKSFVYNSDAAKWQFKAPIIAPIISFVDLTTANSTSSSFISALGNDLSVGAPLGKIRISSPIQFPFDRIANVTANWPAASYPHSYIEITNGGAVGERVLCFSDGTNWRRVRDDVIVI